MKYYKTPEEVYEYLEVHAWGKSNEEITKELNAALGTDYTKAQIIGAKKRRNIKSGLTGRFEKGNIPPYKGKKLPPEIKAKTAKTQFKKGNIPRNSCAVGTIKKTDRYWIKVRNEGGQKKCWQPYHRYLWEQAYGPIPEGYYVEYKDNNPMHCTLDNLVLVSRREHVWMNLRQLKTNNPDINAAALALAKLDIAARDRSKEK